MEASVFTLTVATDVFHSYWHAPVSWAGLCLHNLAMTCARRVLSS